MTLTMADLMRMLRFTLADPRAAARAVIALNLPMQARWLVLVLMGIVPVLVVSGIGAFLNAIYRGALTDELVSPLAFAAAQVAGSALFAFLIYRIGRWQGGTGTFADSVLLVSWLTVVLLAVQLPLLVAALFLPMLAVLFDLIGLVVYCWLLSSFVAELHGFRSRMAVLTWIIGILLFVGIGFAILLLFLMNFTTGGV